MRTVAWTIVAAFLCAGCTNGDEGGGAKVSPAAVSITEVSITEVAAALVQGECTVLDANKASVRIRSGTIPGAVLLSDYQGYALDELPAAKDRKLVFYCANEYCRASDKAAEKAQLAGYTDVNVLRAGIMGWVKAGQKTAMTQ